MVFKKNEVKLLRDRIIHLIEQAKTDLIIRGEDEYNLKVVGEIVSSWLKAKDKLNEAINLIDNLSESFVVETF